jgi:DNA-binding transcriptional LysR family regulator
MASFDERIVNGISVLSAIIDSGTFATAGEVLNMSPSGVSRSIARLEARLGIRLLERTMRSVSLTDEGRRFYEQVMPLLAGLEEAAASAAQGTTAVRGRLRVNLDPYFSRLILGPRLGAFLESYPQLRLEQPREIRIEIDPQSPANSSRRTTWATWSPRASTWPFASASPAPPP